MWVWWIWVGVVDMGGCGVQVWVWWIGVGCSIGVDEVDVWVGDRVVHVGGSKLSLLP